MELVKGESKPSLLVTAWHGMDSAAAASSPALHSTAQHSSVHAADLCLLIIIIIIIIIIIMHLSIRLNRIQIPWTFLC
jgi:hypothetical protein